MAAGASWAAVLGKAQGRERDREVGVPRVKLEKELLPGTPPVPLLRLAPWLHGRGRVSETEGRQGHAAMGSSGRLQELPGRNGPAPGTPELLRSQGGKGPAGPAVAPQKGTPSSPPRRPESVARSLCPRWPAASPRPTAKWLTGRLRPPGLLGLGAARRLTSSRAPRAPASSRGAAGRHGSF